MVSSLTTFLSSACMLLRLSMWRGYWTCQIMNPPCATASVKQSTYSIVKVDNGLVAQGFLRLGTPKHLSLL